MFEMSYLLKNQQRRKSQKEKIIDFIKTKMITGWQFLVLPLLLGYCHFFFLEGVTRETPPR